MFITDFSYDKLVFFIIGYIFFNIMGVTAGLHRYFCHKSFKINKWKERLLLLAATTAGQGQPIFWVALHRGYHHRFADMPEDPHSPVHGFWHSVFLWKFRLKPDAISLKPAFELIRNKDVMFFSKHYRSIFLLFHGLILLISFDLFLYFSMLSIFITLITYNLTNSLNHIRSLGYANFKTKDNSTNVPWLWPIVLGECWHNNHHGRPGSSHFGSKVSGKWWEIDPAGFFIELYKDRI
jgi:stearoyl-CoA desaturase (delta-9 desaturase)